MNFFENARQAKLVRHEEKQDNIARFAGYYLDRLSIVDGASLAQRSGSLVARSPLSPAARAILAAFTEFEALDVQLQVIFARLEPNEELSPWLDLAAERAGSIAPVSLRWARRPQLLDAHEQLVLGTSISWFGDSMRREPESRDAFETFDAFHEEGARRVAASFQSLWALSEPISAGRFRRTADRPAAALGGEPGVAALGQGLPASTSTASTRH